jgi:PAS domain S-box-containing protein
MGMTRPQRYLLFTGLLVFTGMLVLVLFGFDISLKDLRRQEEQKNLALSHTLTYAYGRELENLLQGGTAHSGTFKAALQDLLATTSVVKINLFSAESVTVYSTDPKRIGEAELDNLSLQAALTNKVASDYETFALETAQARQDVRRVVSIYLPVYDHEVKGVALKAGDAAKVVGVFELCSDVTPQLRALWLTHLGLALAATLMIGIVFAGVYFFMGRSSRTLQQHQNELERYALMLQQTPMVLMEATKQGQLLFLNPSAKKHFPELVGSESVPVAPDARHALFAAWETVTAYLQPGSTFEREVSVGDKVYLQKISYNEQSQTYDIYAYDMTGQKRSEAELRRAQREQQAVLDALPDMMFIVSAQGILLDYKLDSTYTADDMRGLHLTELAFLSPVVLQAYTQAIQKALEQQRLQQLEYDLVIDGAQRYYEARVIPLGQERVMALVRDMSSRKMQELALQESESRNRSLITAFPDLIFVVDKEGTFLEVQLDDEHPLMEPLVGRNMSEISFISEEVAQLLKGYVRRALATRSVQTAEYSLPSVGRVSDYEARFVALDDERVLYIARDVTERRQKELALRESEARVQSLLNAIPDMVFVMNREGTYLDFKLDKSHKLLEELVGRNLRELSFMTSEIAEGLLSKLHLTLDTREVQTFEYSLDGYFGDARRLTHYEARFAPIDHEKVLMVVRDVSKRREDEVALQDMTREAQRRAQELLLLDRVRTVATQELELKSVIAKAVDVIAETFDYTMVSIYLLEHGELVLQHQVGYHQVIERLSLDKGVMGKVARTGQAVLLKTAKDDPEALWAFEGINSEICVPLLDAGRTVGVLNLESKEKRFFDEADFRLMTALSETLGIALERARLYHEAKRNEQTYRELYELSRQQGEHLARRADELALLGNVRSATMNAVSLNDLYRTVVEAVVHYLGYSHAFLFEVQGDTFVLAHQIGYDKVISTMPVNQGICGRAVRSKEAVFVADVTTDPDHLNVATEVNSGIYVPFLQGDNVKGVLCVETTKQDDLSLSEADLRLLSSLTDFISMAMTRTQLYQDLQRSELRYRELIENASDIIYRIDLTGKFTYANSVVKRLVGYEEAEVIGKHYLELVRLDQRERVQAFYIKQLKEKLATTYLEFPAVNAAGQEVWIGQNVGLVYEGERVVGMQAVARDITERKRMEEALVKQAEELSSANADLEQFAFIAAHDLQEPLRKIQAFGDRLSLKYSKVLDEQGRDYLARMRNSATRMRSLIDDLLSFARANKQHKPELTSLEPIVKEVLADLQMLIEETRATISVGTLPTLEVDPAQMRQVFQNVLHNALKFRKPEVAPVITVYSHALPSGEWEIRVSDNGIGFDEQYKERVFAVFQRLHSREHYEGTGIGLAIVRRIIEGHGGKVEVSSRPNEGTSLSFTLPGVAKIRTENTQVTVLA